MIKRRIFYAFVIFFLVIQMISFTATSVEAENIPQDARRHMQRGLTAIKMATSVSDYKEAIKEFKKAKQLAPDWPDVYYNLALVQEKVGGHIKVYKSARKNLQKYLGFDISEEDRIKAQKLLSKIESKIGIIRDERTLVGIWCPVTSNEYFAEPRIEIRIGRDGTLVARSLPSKNLMDIAARHFSGRCSAYTNGPFVKVKVSKKETEEVVGAEMSLRIPATVYEQWYWECRDCELKARFNLLRISEDTMLGSVFVSGKYLAAGGPKVVDYSQNFHYKREQNQNQGTQY